MKPLIIEDPDFNNTNICIVTGCASGIGRATAIAAAKNNLFVVGLDNDDVGVIDTVKAIRDFDGCMVFIKTDLTRTEDIDTAIARAANFGKIKYLINVAGIQRINSIENFEMEDYDLMMGIMLRAPFYLSKLCIPHMHKNGGVIANMASVHAHICTKNKAAYNIAKFGLRALSQSISAEGEGRIRSFTVSTGFVKTPLALNQIAAQAEQRGITQDQVISDVMLGKSRIKKMMAPEEVADLIMFGMSNRGEYLVGGDLLFDGGMVLTY